MAGMATVSAPQAPAQKGMRGGWTAADLESLPDDGRRYEIIDGVLLVSPAPIKRHQRASATLYRLLHNACPHAYEVFYAPLDWKVSDSTVFQPDLMVVPATAVDEPIATPVLAVEVASPSTAEVDRTRKFAAYERAGVGQYWIVDPGGDGSAPSVEVYDLAESGGYELQVRAVGGERVDVAGPVPISVIPAELIV